MQYTSNYHLPQWAMADRIQMGTFNDMTAALEDALTGHDGKLAGQQDTLAAHAARMDKLGNCQIYYSTYTGDGGRNGKTLYFPKKPVLVLVLDCGAGFLISSRNADRAVMHNGGTVVQVAATWGDTSLRWDNSAYNYFTGKDQAYLVVAFLDMAE